MGEAGQLGRPERRAAGCHVTVDDTFAGAPVAVFVEPDTQTAIALSRIADGRTLTFEARKADGETRPAFFDKETGTRWSLEGTAEVGPLKGKTYIVKIEANTKNGDLATRTITIVGV